MKLHKYSDSNPLMELLEREKYLLYQWSYVEQTYTKWMEGGHIDESIWKEVTGLVTWFWRGIVGLFHGKHWVPPFFLLIWLPVISHSKGGVDRLDCSFVFPVIFLLCLENWLHHKWHMRNPIPIQVSSKHQNYGD